MSAGQPGFIGSGVNRLVGAMAPTVIDAVDLEAVLDKIDLDTLIARLDVDALLARIDVDAIVSRVSIAAIMEQVDVNAIVAKVDLDALMARIDIDALLARIDVAALADRAEIGRLVTESSTQVAGSALDLARRQVVGLDMVITRLAMRLVGKQPDEMPTGPDQLQWASEETS